MVKKPRTPKQLIKPEKKTYSFHLVKANVEQLAEMARNESIPISEVIDEAISYYLETLKDPKP